MKNAKGFTLVEVLGAIALLGIIIAIAIPVYNRTSESTKQKAYETKAQQIELAAEKWASEINLSSAKTITVNYLVSEGYFQADEIENDENVVYNPKDNSSMICYTIDVTIDNNNPEAKLSDQENCDLVISEEIDRNIIVSAYKYDNETQKILDTTNLDKNSAFKELDWTNTAVLLVVESEVYSGYTKVTFSNSGTTITKNVENNNIFASKDVKKDLELNADQYANVFVVDAAVFLNSTYDISLYTNEGTKTTDTIVKIDKESATANIINDSNWSNANKKVTIQGSDGSGSGLKGFYVSDKQQYDNNLELIETTYETKITRQEGTYYVWTLDNAGNLSDEYVTSFEVTNIDDTNPVISNFEPHFTKLNGYTYNQSGYINVRISDADSGIKNAQYCLTTGSSCTPNINLNLDINAEGKVNFPTQKAANRLCVKAVDNVGNETTKCDTNTYLVDGTAPTNVSAKYQTNSIGIINVTGTDAESDINKVVCKYGTTTSLSSTKNATKSGSQYVCDLGNLTSKQKYYAKAEVYNNSGLISTTSTITFTPAITPEIAYDEICNGQTYCPQGILVRYGRYTFTMFKKSGSTYWALLNGTYGSGKVINAGCCDCSCCYYSNCNLGSSRNSLTDAVRSFYNVLPSSKSRKLSSVYQATGYYDARTNSDRTSARGWTSPVGLLNYTDWNRIKNYSYASVGQYYALSTVYVNGSAISSSRLAPYAILVNGRSMTYNSNPLSTVTARPLIIINGNIPFDGGNGTASNPYIMN